MVHYGRAGIGVGAQGGHLAQHGADGVGRCVGGRGFPEG